jgi:hypothetical protein
MTSGANLKSKKQERQISGCDCHIKERYYFERDEKITKEILGQSCGMGPEFRGPTRAS